MSDQIIIGLIAKAYNALSVIDPAYKPRPQQQNMIKRASALFGRGVVGIGSGYPRSSPNVCRGGM
jgi:hypothetical protein